MRVPLPNGRSVDFNVQYQLSLRLSPTTHQQLRRWAQDERTTMNSLIEAIITTAAARHVPVEPDVIDVDVSRETHELEQP